MRQYRLFRAHVNFNTNSKLYPYDTQFPSLKLQSLDHGRDSIQLTTRMLDSLDGKELDGGNHSLSNLTDVQARIFIWSKLLR